MFRTIARYLLPLLLLSQASAAPAAASEPVFVPVYEVDFPDPFVIQHQGEFLAFSTNARGLNVPVALSGNLVDWQPARDAAGKPVDAMPGLAAWVKGGRTWAPEVMKVGTRWLLYYTAHHAARNKQCIGVASAADPRGPFGSQKSHAR